MEGQTFLRDGVMMVRVPDGREFRVSDVMRLNNPGMEYDDMTGEAMAMTPPRDGGGSSKPREYSFGDVGSETLARTIDDVSSTAGGGGEITRSLLPEDWQQTFPDAMLAAGDYGLAGLLGLVGGVETAAGYAGDAVERAQNAVGLNGRYAPGGSAKALQADLMGMFDAAGAGPEGRMIAAIKAALPAGAPRAAARAVVDRLNQPGQMPTTYSNPIPGLLGDASSAAADPAIQRADEVLGLLKSGRTDEVTDAMLDMGDPVLNARMNEHLYRNYDLPMDAASRAARRDAAYKSGLYSGTGEDFTAFNDTAAYASTSPDVAFSYAPSDGGSIMPLAMRAQHGSPVVEAGGANWNRLNPSMRADPATFRIPDEMAPSDPKSFAQWPMATRDYEAAARREGFSGVTFNDIVDVGGYMSKARPPVGTPEFEELVRYMNAVGKPATVEARLYPNQIRSAFARFDPRLSPLRNLNAALAAGVPLGLLSMSEEE